MVTRRFYDGFLNLINHRTMRINYKNTALGLIDDPDNFNFSFPDPEMTPKKTPGELKKFGYDLLANSKYLKWFTNLIVSGAFGVSGHLHWYYYGPGKKEKKLIWVDEYQKQGYTRKAKVKQQNLNNKGAQDTDD